LFKPCPGLPVEVNAELKPIYLKLSEDALLTRCLDGTTQNQDEALHGMIWDRVPKEMFVGTDILELGKNDAVSHFNIGGEVELRWLKAVFCTFQDVDLMCHYYQLLSLDATIMVSKNCPISGEHVGIIFMTQ